LIGLCTPLQTTDIVTLVYLRHVTAVLLIQPLRLMSHMQFYRTTSSSQQSCNSLSNYSSALLCNIVIKMRRTLIGQFLFMHNVAVYDMHSCILQLCRAIKLHDKVAW